MAGGARGLHVWTEAGGVHGAGALGPCSGRSGQRVRLWAEPHAWRVAEALAWHDRHWELWAPCFRSAPVLQGAPCSPRRAHGGAAASPPRTHGGSGARAAVTAECLAICLHVQIFPRAPDLIVRKRRPQRCRVCMTRKLGGRCSCSSAFCVDPLLPHFGWRWAESSPPRPPRLRGRRPEPLPCRGHSTSACVGWELRGR